jgi:hypothetical protein
MRSGKIKFLRAKHGADAPCDTIETGESAGTGKWFDRCQTLEVVVERLGGYDDI